MPADMGDGPPQSLSCLLQLPGEQVGGTGSAERVEEGSGDVSEDATPARSAPPRHGSADAGESSSPGVLDEFWPWISLCSISPPLFLVAFIIRPLALATMSVILLHVALE